MAQEGCQCKTDLHHINSKRKVSRTTLVTGVKLRHSRYQGSSRYLSGGDNRNFVDGLCEGEIGLEKSINEGYYVAAVGSVPRRKLSGQSCQLCPQPAKRPVGDSYCHFCTVQQFSNTVVRHAEKGKPS